MSNFNPNAAADENSGIFGLPPEPPFTAQDAALVYLPVPWEATTSYGGGTSRGPEAILAASRQVDLHDLDVQNPYEAGLHLLPECTDIRAWNAEAKAAAGRGDTKLVNELGGKLNDEVYRQTQRLLESGKIIGLIGGDHSTPFGALQAVGEKHRAFGVLHFDAHLDLRDAYQGFTWSHASIMRNVIDRIPAVEKLVQVGIRDVCEEEVAFATVHRQRISTHYDRDLARRKFEGATWAQLCREIVALLPQEVWVSFDIDGLDPRFCPHTGTPVPGGLDFNEANFLLATLARSGRRIIGFDLNEVAPGPEGDEWDANVAARLLYKLTGWTLSSQGKAKGRI